MRIAVIIPAHNSAKHIARALSSALEQSYEPEEIIVVDDASTDETLSEIATFSDERLRVLHREVPGQGGYAARNEAAGASSSQWLAFLDADDEWRPDHLEALAALHTAVPSAELLSTGWWNVSPEGELAHNHYSARFDHEGTVALDLVTFLRRWSAGWAPVWTSAACVERSALLAAGGFPSERCTRGGDVDTWLRVMLRRKPLAYAPRATALYHRDVESSVTQRSAPQVSHCTGATLREALSSEKRPLVRLLLKRLGNFHKKDPLRKKARRSGLHLSDVRELYSMASPMFFLLSLALVLVPVGLLRRLWALRSSFRSRLKGRRQPGSTGATSARGSASGTGGTGATDKEGPSQ